MKPAETRSDNELIQRCLGGDQDAWKDLISQYQRLVYSIANQFCPQPEDASDIFQQVWLALYQHLSELRNVQALPAWLITVTRRQAYAVIQEKRGSEQLDEEQLEKGPADMESPVSQIKREHAIERVCRLVAEKLILDEPRAVHDTVDASMAPAQALDEGTEAVVVADVYRVVADL